jgi:two-component system, OmpR family, sensor histidine kinase SenX3
MVYVFAVLAIVGWMIVFWQRRNQESFALPEADVIQPLNEDAENGETLNVLDALPLGVVVVGADGQEVFRNKAAAEVTGLRHVDVLVEEVIERLVRLASIGQLNSEQIELAGPPQRVLNVRVTPLPEGGSIATIDDITERWRLDQVRTDFVANVSHELKTPVGAISVLAETIEGETEDELVLRLVRRMIIESERMSRTINELLELSRIEMGGEMLSAPVDLNDVISEAIDRAQPLATRQGVAIEFEKSLDESIISGDHFQLVSAVSNLVDNAVKYSDDGDLVRVSVSSSDGTVEVQVADQGIGIPMGSLERIFERFYRVDRARSRGTGGTGLGLSIVRHVVTNHGGEVNVRSREGEGSTFILRFPSILGSE